MHGNRGFEPRQLGSSLLTLGTPACSATQTGSPQHPHKSVSPFHSSFNPSGQATIVLHKTRLASCPEVNKNLISVQKIMTSIKRLPSSHLGKLISLIKSTLRPFSLPPPNISTSSVFRPTSSCFREGEKHNSFFPCRSHEESSYN